MLQRLSNSFVWCVALISLLGLTMVACNTVAPETEANLANVASEELMISALGAGDCPPSESICGLVAESVYPTCPPDYPYKNPGEFRSCVARALSSAIQDLQLQGCLSNGERQQLSACVEARIFASVDSAPGSRKWNFEEEAGH